MRLGLRLVSLALLGQSLVGCGEGRYRLGGYAGPGNNPEPPMGIAGVARRWRCLRVRPSLATLWTGIRTFAASGVVSTAHLWRSRRVESSNKSRFLPLVRALHSAAVWMRLEHSFIAAAVTFLLRGSAVSAARTSALCSRPRTSAAPARFLDRHRIRKSRRCDHHQLTLHTPAEDGIGSSTWRADRGGNEA